MEGGSDFSRIPRRNAASLSTLGAGRQGMPLSVEPRRLASLLDQEKVLSVNESELVRRAQMKASFEGSGSSSPSGVSEDLMEAVDAMLRLEEHRSASVDPLEQHRSASPLSVHPQGSAVPSPYLPTIHGRGLRLPARVLLTEMQRVSRPNTSADEFSAFLEKWLLEGDIIARATEEEFSKRFKMGYSIGEGATSSVRVAVRQTDGVEVAIKTIDVKMFMSHRQLFREIAILSHLEHPNIIKLHSAFMTEAHVYLVMELAHGEPLFDAIVRMRIYSERDARSIMKTLLGAVAYLHSVGIVHRDLKPENIVVDASNVCELKIVDFGFAGYDVSERHDGLTTPVGGTPGYKAPDMLVSTSAGAAGGAYGEHVDVWSLGVIAYILLCGFPPFFSHPAVKDSLDFLTNAPYWYFINEDTPELQQENRDGRVQFPSPFWDNVTRTAQEFVLALLKVNKMERLTCVQALQHDWFTCEIPVVVDQSHLLLDIYDSTNNDQDTTQRLDRGWELLPRVVRRRIHHTLEPLSSELGTKLATRPTLSQLKSLGIYHSGQGLATDGN